MNLFDNTINLKNPIEWLLELDRLKQYENPPTRLHIVVTMLQDLLGKFTDTNENVKIEIREEIRFLERGSNVQFNELSDGYKTVISWVCDLLFHLSIAQPMVSDIKDYQGIVLVDEIDLHLHPKWAYSIVKKLRTWFPNIQFFFTTHSPIVILGASDDAVFYKVYKEEGVTKISEPYYSKDFSNAMANIIITSPLFDLETAAMKTNSKDLDTNDSSLHSKIYKKVSEYMDEKRKQGKKLFTENEIDQIINEALILSKGESV
jgi:predicted ATP-binding protein involved in virulence